MQTTSTRAGAGARPVSWREGLTLPPIESPFLERQLAEAGIAPALADGIRALSRDGYVVLDIDLPDFDRRVDRILTDLAGRYGKDRRVSEAWYWNEDVRALACLPQVLQTLQLVYQRRVIPFQTLNFEVGTEQPAHSDTIHFHSLPRHWMCGVWVALEDVSPDAGPLVVYPGSHVLPDYEMQDLGVPHDPAHYGQYEEFVAELLRAKGYSSKPLLLKKGQAAIWLANLFHGGTAIRDKSRTRKSQVTHYYFEGCQYFFPMQSDLPGGSIIRREVIDLTTGRFVTHLHEGRPVDLGDLSKVCTYPRPLPDWVVKANGGRTA